MAEMVGVLDDFIARVGVPAAGAATFDRDGRCDVSVRGVVKRGGDQPVTADQQWHLGSCTKAITAALYARLVEQGVAKWDVPVLDLFPDLAGDADPGWGGPTVDDLLRCRAGVPANLPRRQMKPAWADQRPLPEQRTAVALDVLRVAPRRPGRFLYSNLSYVLAGAAIDRLARSYEEALTDLILEPLGVRSAGFGAPPEIWGHSARVPVPPPGVGKGKPAPPDRVTSDNPAVYGPAGRLHLTLGDWAAIQRALFLDTGDGLLTSSSVERLLQLPADRGIAMGWASAAKVPGASYVMQGSNTAWSATVLLDTDRTRGVLFAVNDGRLRVLLASVQAASLLLDG